MKQLTRRQAHSRKGKWSHGAEGWGCGGGNSGGKEAGNVVSGFIGFHNLNFTKF